MEQYGRYRDIVRSTYNGILQTQLRESFQRDDAEEIYKEAYTMLGKPQTLPQLVPIGNKAPVLGYGSLLS